MSESRLAGYLLFTGSLLVLTTITFEYSIGWLDVVLSTEEGLTFLRENWKGMNIIWTVQFMGFILWCISFLLLLKAKNGFPAVLWASLFLCMVMVAVGYSITLGSYPSALNAIRESPEIFNTVRGAVSVLYGYGLRVGLLLLLLNFVIETFRKSGIVGLRLGSITLLIFVLGIIVGQLSPLPMKLTSATIFLIPLMTGLSIISAHKRS